MYVSTQRLAHFSSTNICDRMQSQAIEQLIVPQQIFPYTIDDQMKQLMLLVKKKSHRQVSDLLLRILGGRYEVDSLQMSEVDIPSQNVNVQKFAHVFLPVVAIEVTLPELLPYIRELLVYALLFQVSRSGVSEICYELNQTSHGRGIAGASTAQEACRRRTRQFEGCARIERGL